MQTSNHVDTFSLDFAFSFAITILIRPLIARGNVSNANILSLIAFIISYRLFADKLVYALNRATVVLIIILVNKTQLLLILRDIAAYTLLAKFIPTTKIRNPLLKTLENAAKSRILLICADRQTRQCYLTICAILKHYNFNIHVSLATDTLHLLLKGLVIKMLDFMQDILDDIYSSTIISLLFILKAPFALHFIHAVCDLVTLAQYKSYDEDTLAYIQGHALTYIIQDIRIYGALDSICTRANSEAHYITIVKQFYSMINKKEYILQIYRTYSTRVTRPLLFRRLRYKRHNDSKHCDKKVLYLILIIINYTRYDKDRKHIAYIRAFSKVLLFNNNRQIDNTTRMLSMPFKFYNLSTIIRLVHLVLRDLPNSITYTTISYYVNNYIN
ncbi:hypothetical protein HBH92_160970 [Parastagonospora nodorum]|nr:hypothetical protein HBH92_160970 [Parastagonospora nodorum]KAH4428735.1 hypothetical protein HBH91_242390 [Parastagonospora nodorum]KAH4449860.1 hypothetical protein HBH93_043750 [Parastagonospora nodorum]KAH4551873.1 hypothetical protein HBH85_038700 [Parastagonospora nodorum]KAH4564829.1 hypothetical protein HBH86_053520 [Parastagonospora nodorum]